MQSSSTPFKGLQVSRGACQGKVHRSRRQVEAAQGPEVEGWQLRLDVLRQQNVTQLPNLVTHRVPCSTTLPESLHLSFPICIRSCGGMKVPEHFNQCLQRMITNAGVRNLQVVLWYDMQFSSNVNPACMKGMKHV